MKILMFGPAYGHNIEPFLDFFVQSKDHELSFVYSGDDYFAKEGRYSKIKFFKLGLNLISIFKLILEVRTKPEISTKTIII